MAGLSKRYMGTEYWLNKENSEFDFGVFVL